MIDRNGCSLNSTPTTAATISIRSKPGVSRTVLTQVRRALATLAPATSRPIRQRRAAGPSGLPHSAGPAAQRAGAGRHQHDRGRQSLARRELLAGPQCRSRRARSGRISSAPRCACTSTPTGVWPSSTGHIGWPITTRRTTFAITSNWLRKLLRQSACGLADNAARCPQPHRPPPQKRSVDALRIPVNLTRQQQPTFGLH
jgi:hypothetical protein